MSRLELRVNLWVVVLGALAALAFSLFVFLALGVLGFVGPDRGRALLVLVQFVSQLVAGYVAGRLAGDARLFHGSLSALTLVVITTAISVARSPFAALPVFLLLGLVALVIGAAGGALADRRIFDSGFGRAPQE